MCVCVCATSFGACYFFFFMMKRDVRIFFFFFEVLNNSKIVFNRYIVNIKMCYWFECVKKKKIKTFGQKSDFDLEDDNFYIDLLSFELFFIV